MADVLSGGRIELGFGAGADAAASAAFGRDHRRRHRDCAAVVDRVCEALEGSWPVPLAACRIVGPGEPPSAVLRRWDRDPARDLATELVVQTQPAAAPFTTHLATLRELATVLRTGPSERTPVPVGTGSPSGPTG